MRHRTIRALALTATHAGALALGFALSVYFLPILTAPPSPDATILAQSAQDARYRAELTWSLRDSDRLHWGEGTIAVTSGTHHHRTLPHEGTRHWAGTDGRRAQARSLADP